MVAGRIGAASVKSFSAATAAFGGLARIAFAASIPASPDLMKASALAKTSRLPEPSSGSTTLSPATKPSRSSPDFTNVTSFIALPRLCYGRQCARLARGRQPTKTQRKQGGMLMIRWMTAMAVAISLLAAGGDASAQGARTANWPSGPVKMFVGFAAGGSTDIIARDIGHELEKVWGQPVVIETRAGA